MVVGRRWTIEESFQTGKGLTGLDEARFGLGLRLRNAVEALTSDLDVQWGIWLRGGRFDTCASSAAPRTATRSTAARHPEPSARRKDSDFCTRHSAACGSVQNVAVVVPMKLVCA